MFMPPSYFGRFPDLVLDGSADFLCGSGGVLSILRSTSSGFCGLGCSCFMSGV